MEELEEMEAEEENGAPGMTHRYQKEMAVPPTAPVSDPLVAEPDKSSSVPKAAIEGRTRPATAHRTLERIVR